MNYADVILLQKTGLGSDTVTYKIPEDLAVQVGQSVQVEYRHKSKNALVWKIHHNTPDFKTKDIFCINQERPLLSKWQLKVVNWISEYYFCSKEKVLKLFIPESIFNSKPTKNRTKKQEQNNETIKNELTGKQKDIFDKIISEKKNNFLIQGITGSGKTQIYTALAKENLKQGLQTLILVPEISLTPQTIEYFERRLNTKAAILHSKLSKGERTQNWLDIYSNKAKLVIGSRSAIFAPFQSLRTIIVDEEHEGSYKQDQAPRYNAIAVAEAIQKELEDVQIVYGSATPNAETAIKLEHTTFQLNERFGNFPLPQIEIVDLRDEFKKNNYSIFSEQLQAEIKQALEQKEQTLLLLNRRGSASSLVCRDCGHSVNCPNCDTSMTYHAYTLQSPTLICHHCGKISQPPSQCPACQGPHIKHIGIGTQRIEEEVKKLFPEARTLRADKDTTSTKHGFKDIYHAFKKHEADILVGTQMIAKGLHLPKVNLVGVIISDIGLNIPDFRASERIFQLLTQVAGRAGRESHRGKVIIQTYTPENPLFQLLKNHDYKGFFELEKTQRSILKNPPYSQLAKITIQDPSAKKSLDLTVTIFTQLQTYTRDQKIDTKIVLTHYPSYLPRLKNKYRNVILIKDLDKKYIHPLLSSLPKEHLNNPDIKIDIDPVNTG